MVLNPQTTRFNVTNLGETKGSLGEVAKFNLVEVGKFISKFAIWLSNSPHNWLLCNLVSNFLRNFANVAW